MNSVRNTRVPVLIQYTGKPGAIGLSSPGLPDTVLIEVRDAGARLNAYHREPLHLTIDLRQYIHGEKGTIHVPSDALRRSISDILQGTSRLIETFPEEIRCAYFTEQEKIVPVSSRCVLELASEYQLAAAPTLSRTKIKIFGQEKSLRDIDSLYTEATTLTELTDTSTIRLALDIPNDVRAEADSVDLCVIAERFTEKKFILPIHITGVPAGCHLRLFPREVEVSVRVGISHFSSVQASDLRATCTYTPNSADKLDVELHYSNPYITSAWVYPGVVEFLVEQRKRYKWLTCRLNISVLNRILTPAFKR
jgi:hypothetical protein